MYTPYVLRYMGIIGDIHHSHYIAATWQGFNCNCQFSVSVPIMLSPSDREDFSPLPEAIGARGRQAALARIVDDLHIDYMPSLTISAATTLELSSLCSWQWQTFVSPCMERIGELTQFQAREVSCSLCAVGVGNYLLSSLTGGMYISVCRAVQ